MGWRDSIRSWFDGAGTGDMSDHEREARRAGFDGLTGRPPSGNGASSFHLFWVEPAGDWIGAEVTIEVVEAPRVAELFFWAMQVSFQDGGRETGGAHIGLQWFPPHPGSTAVNWGGYAATGGGILDGSASALPSAVDNPNTRDFPWVPHRRYTTRVVAVPGEGPRGLTAWRGTVTDETTGTLTHIRDLWAPGDRVGRPMVWSEVFAACDDPPTSVRWTDAALISPGGARQRVAAATVNYQLVREGGCARTDAVVSADGRGFEQRTNTERTTPQGTVLHLPS